MAETKAKKKRKGGHWTQTPEGRKRMKSVLQRLAQARRKEGVEVDVKPGLAQVAEAEKLLRSRLDDIDAERVHIESALASLGCVR